MSRCVIRLRSEVQATNDGRYNADCFLGNLFADADDGSLVGSRRYVQWPNKEGLVGLVCFPIFSGFTVGVPPPPPPDEPIP